MATQVKIKRSSVSGRVPVTTDLELGELAINTYDGKLYLKKNNGTESVVEVGLSGGGGSTGLDFQSYTATAGQTTFAVAYTPPNVTVVVNGAVLNPADYTATNGTSVVLSTACNTGDVVSVYGFATLSVGYGLPSLTGNSGKYLSTDGTSVSWQTVSGGGTADLSAVAQNILPSTDVTYDLGSASKRWRDLYLSGSTINLGGATITTDNTTGAIALMPKPTVADPNPSGIVISPAGGIASVASTGGEISSENFTSAASQAEFLGGGTLTLGEAQLASGTAVNFTGIPSWVKRITLTAFGLSASGTSSVAFRVGGASGIKTTGYFSGLVFPTPAWTSAAGFQTLGLYVCAASAPMVVYGSATLTKVVDNKWVWSGSFARDDTTDMMNIVSGGVDLNEQLTQVQVTTFAGTDPLDAGTINIMYE